MVTRSNRVIVFHGPAQEFELPARLAFHIENAGLPCVDVYQARQRVVALVLFARKASMDASIVLTPTRPALNRTDSVCSMPSAFNVTSCVARTLAPSLSVSFAFGRRKPY